MIRSLVVGIVLAAPALGAAQTTPSEQAGAGAQQMVRAAGMPLPDGALPPGSLTVRVVQGAFSGNLADIDVVIDVNGDGPKRGRTGADGRALFAHLPIGARVRATAAVKGERLESEPFTMPPDAGIRVLFVAGEGFVDTATAAGAASIPTMGGTTPDAGQAAASSGPTTAAARDAGVAAFRIVMVSSTVLAFAIVAWRWWARTTIR